MKTLRKFLIAALFAALTLAAGIFAAACSNEDETGGDTAYTLTLDLDGGTLSTSSLSLKEGENIYDAVKDLVPVKTGVTFGAWFYGENAIAEDMTMPAADLTLVAKYKVYYTVEVYLEQQGGSYARADELFEEGSGYVGTAISPQAPTVEGYERTDMPAGGTPVTSITLGENAAENVLRFYYRIEREVISFSAGALTATGSVPSIELMRGGAYTLPENGFKLEGYRFAGWSTAAGGEVEKQPGEEVENAVRSVQYFAVWDRGYTDRMGTSDVIFFPRGAKTTAILSRGGVELDAEQYLGVRDGDEFSFRDGETRGKIFEDYTFCYAQNEYLGKYVFYDHNEGDAYFEETTLTVDEYLGAVYAYSDEKGAHSVSGSLAFDRENGDYLFTESGEGRTAFNCLLGADDGGTKIFSIRGDEAGFYLDFWIVDRETGQGFSMGDMLMLDGYGKAYVYPSTGYFVCEGVYTVSGTYSSSTGERFVKMSCVIEDPYGILDGTEGIFARSIYTMPSGEAEYGYYVFADSYEGNYTAADGSTLTLDGFGNFADSAVYAPAQGERVQGGYELSMIYNEGAVIVTLADGTQFKLDFSDRLSPSFAPYAPTAAYTEYHLLGSGEAVGFPLLLLYDEDYGDGTLGKKAELYVSFDEGDTLQYAARGYYTATEIGSGFLLYSFVRTEVESIFSFNVPETMKFYTTELISSETLWRLPVYCILEENDVKNYDVVELPDGSYFWAHREITFAGVGSLWFVGGAVIEGTFTISRSRYFDTVRGTFLYGDGNATRTLSYLLNADADGVYHASDGGGEETELYFYYVDSGSSSGQYIMDFVLDGQGNAKWQDDQGEWQSGTYQEVGKTEFDDQIFTLRIAGEIKFRFTIYQLRGSSVMNVYFKYDGRTQGDYTAADGSALHLDGYFYASYTAADGTSSFGTYSVDPSRTVVLFTYDETGAAQYFRINTSSRLLNILDDAYGEWYLVNASLQFVNFFTIRFDGLGNFSVYTQLGALYSSGLYAPFGTDGEYILYDADLGASLGKHDFRISFYRPAMGTSACVVYDEDLKGLFINDDLDILQLDGYGNASLYTADGRYGGTGYSTVVDEENGFMYLTFEADYSEVYFLLDREEGTFYLLDYSAFDLVYYSDEFKLLSFGSDAAARVNLKGTRYTEGEDGSRTEEEYETLFSGFYYVWEGKTHVYPYDYETESSTHHVLDFAPGKDVANFTYDGATYTLWDGNEIRIRGVVEFYGKDNEPTGEDPIDAEFAFKLKDNGQNYNLAGQFVLGGQTYNDFTLNFYTDGGFRPTVTYNYVDYAISFGVEGDTRTFTVRAGYIVEDMPDFYDNFRETETVHLGGHIVKEFIGFGPLELRQAEYSGEFYYLYDKATFSEPITFSEIKAEELVKVGYRGDNGTGSGSLGYCYEIVFAFKGVNYAVDFYETYAEENEGTVYVLQGFYSYKEFEADGYTVRLKFFEHATTQNTPGYGVEGAKGKPYAATVFKDGEAIVNYDTGVTIGGDAVWLIEFTGVNDNGYSRAGAGYLVKYAYAPDGAAVQSVTVEKYAFKQLATASGDFFFNLFVDGEGNIAQVIAVAYKVSSDAWAWVEEAHDLTRNADGTEWVFYGKAGSAIENKFTAVFEQSASLGLTVRVKTEIAG